MDLVSLVSCSSRSPALAWCSVTVPAQVTGKLWSYKEVADEQTGMNLGSETSPAKGFSFVFLLALRKFLVSPSRIIPSNEIASVLQLFSTVYDFVMGNVFVTQC